MQFTMYGILLCNKRIIKLINGRMGLCLKYYFLLTRKIKLFAKPYAVNHILLRQYIPLVLIIWNLNLLMYLVKLPFSYCHKNYDNFKSLIVINRIKIQQYVVLKCFFFILNVNCFQGRNVHYLNVTVFEHKSPIGYTATFWFSSSYLFMWPQI